MPGSRLEPAGGRTYIDMAGVVIAGHVRVDAMRILFFLLLVILIAHIGFWSTLGAVLGAMAMFVLFGFLAIALVLVGSVLLVAGLVH
jgi:hypothetical protein